MAEAPADRAQRTPAREGTVASVIPAVEVMHPEVARALRAMPGMERLRLAHEAWEMARDRLTEYVAFPHPDWSPEDVQREVARRLLGVAGGAAPVPR
jgi:hypothetical protein